MSSSELRRVVEIAHAFRDAATTLKNVASRELDSENARTRANPDRSRPKQPRVEISASEVETSPITVLVSWAHRGENWDDEESAGWAREVVTFATRLRGLGIDAELDLFHTHETHIDWTRFGQQRVRESDFIIVAVSDAWATRWSGENSPQVGAGAVVEADTLKGLFRRDQSEFQRRVLMVVLPSQGTDAIPLDLNRLNYYKIDPEDPDSFDDLVRSLTGQPLYVKPDIGSVPVLPPAVAASLGVRKSSDRTDEYSDYLALRKRIERERGRRQKSGKSTDDLSVLLGVMDALEE